MNNYIILFLTLLILHIIFNKNFTGLKSRYNDINKLKFVHITKSAGTSIENVGYKYKWGRYDVDYLNNFELNKKKLYKCIRYKSYNIFNNPDHDNPYYDNNLLKEIDNCKWHVPLYSYKKNPYKNYDLFIVVRNPYTRCISEFYCPYAKDWEEEVNKNATKEELNKWIINSITDNEIKSKTLHLIPQHYYLYDKDNNIIINHVLHFENIKTEFDNLMKQYNSPMRLNVHTNKSKGKRYTIDDLTDETKKVIIKYYKKDFELFGYET